MTDTANDQNKAAILAASIAMEEYYRAGGERHQDAMCAAIVAYLCAKAQRLEQDVGIDDIRPRTLYRLAAELRSLGDSHGL